MTIRLVILLLGYSMLGMGVLLLGPAFLFFRLYPYSINCFLLCAIIYTLFGLAISFALHYQEKMLQLRHVLMSTIFWWLGSIILGAIPIAFFGYLPHAALFESAYALTTTGAAALSTSLASPSVHLWLAQLAWLGGLITIISAMTVFFYPSFFGAKIILHSRSVRNILVKYTDFQQALRYVLLFYCGMTLAFWVYYTNLGFEPFSTVLMAFLTPSSAGVLAFPEQVHMLDTHMQLWLVPCLLIGGLHFVSLRSGNFLIAENVIYLILTVILGGVFFLSAFVRNDPDPFFSSPHIAGQIFNAASSLSTNGYIVNALPSIPLLLCSVLIGGASLSTAGGIKIYRWYVILVRLKSELQQLSKPHGVFAGDSGQGTPFGVWVYFLTFTMGLGFILLLLSVFDFPLDEATILATAMLCNAGPLFEAADIGAGRGFSEFGAALQLFLIPVMVLGRLETAAALILVNSLFRKTHGSTLLR